MGTNKLGHEEEGWQTTPVVRRSSHAKFERTEDRTSMKTCTFTSIASPRPISCYPLHTSLDSVDFLIKSSTARARASSIHYPPLLGSSWFHSLCRFLLYPALLHCRSSPDKTPTTSTPGSSSRLPLFVAHFPRAFLPSPQSLQLGVSQLLFSHILTWKNRPRMQNILGSQVPPKTIYNSSGCPNGNMSSKSFLFLDCQE